MCWLPFANSLVRDPLGRKPAEDRLASAAWRREFAAQAGLSNLPRWTPAIQARLAELRSAMQGWAHRLANTGELSPADLDTLNAYLQQVVVRTSLQRARTGWRRELQPRVSGVAAWVFAICNDFAEFLLSEDPHRLRLCDNPACQWIFYDATRSRTRRWCADSCGDLIKVRAFRARQQGPQRRRGKKAGRGQTPG